MRVSFFPQVRAQLAQNRALMPFRTAKTDVHAVCTDVHAPRRSAVQDGANGVHIPPCVQDGVRGVLCTGVVHATPPSTPGVHGGRARGVHVPRVFAMRKALPLVHGVFPLLDGSSPPRVHVRAHGVHIGFPRPEGRFPRFLGALCTRFGEKRERSFPTPRARGAHRSAPPPAPGPRSRARGGGGRRPPLGARLTRGRAVCGSPPCAPL